jgi:hypothetical protein
LTDTPIPLGATERIVATAPADAATLVSDGNSRWVEADGVLYLVANEHYKAPDVAA